MQLTSETWRDIQRYYVNTYVKLPELGEKLIYIYEVSASGIKFKDLAGEEGIIYLNNNDPYTLEYILPHKSNYQINGVCYNLSRIPAKQYYRGIHEQNCVIRQLTTTGEWKRASFTRDNLMSYVEKSPFVRLTTALKEGFASAALSNRFSWGIKGKIYCDQTIIGNLKDRIISVHPLFFEEITKLIHTTGCATSFDIKVSKL